MKYLTIRNGWYVYNRCVPNRLKNFDARQRVRIALNTQCEMTAIKRLIAVNDNIEQYWQSLIELKQAHTKEKFKKLV